MRFALICGLLVLSTACGDNFADVQKADTIEAYETYLKNNPDNRFMLEINSRLEDLYLQAARDAKALEAYDAYLARFPEGVLREKAILEREVFLYDWANAENTGESWNTFIEEYPRAEKTRRARAKRMIAVHEYQEFLDLSPPRMEQINLAEDPEGPLNGWGFYVDVTNNGSRTIESMYLTIEYLGAEGRAVGSREWLLVAPYPPIPVPEVQKTPMKPGETREWSWETGNMPEGWERKVRVYVSRIMLQGQSKAKK
jgi:tetratricopeptide (TPR) repeat protein